MSKPSAKTEKPAPKTTPNPRVPNLPSTTGNKSGGGRGNYSPSK